MKQPAASPGRAEKPPQQQLPAPPGLARLLLSKSRRGALSRRAPATSPMFVSRPGRSRGAGADGGEPSSPKVTCIGQVRMRNKGKKKKKKMGAAAPSPEKVSAARGYCRCLKKAFLCGGLFGGFDYQRRGTHHKAAPEPEVVERGRRSPWVFSSRDVAVAAAPKPTDPRRDGAGEEEEEGQMGVFGSVERDETEQPGIDGDGDDEGGEEGKPAAAEEDVLASSAAPPKNALLLMRCRSAPHNRSSPLTARFAAAPSPTQDTVDIAAAAPARLSPSPAPSPRKAEKAAAVGREHDTWLELEAPVAREQEEEVCGEEHEDDEEEEEEEEMRCSSARPLVLPRCKSEPATTAAAKMAAGTDAEATPSGCFWANGGGSGRRRHAPLPPATFAAPMALTGH